MYENRKKNKVRIEKHQITRKLAATFFALTVVLFAVFFLYMGINENVTVFSPRFSPYYGTIINLTPETVRDDAAPMGTRTVYSWLMDAHCETGDYLCFYVSNHHVNVSVDGEQIYSLHSSGENPGKNVGKSISSNWCIIPLEPEDAGKQFTVTLTPLIGELLPRNVEFLVGSNYNIILAQLREDAPQLLLAVMCIALGLIIFLIQCYLQIFSGTAQWDMLFLGVFSMILGVWRITDIRSAPLIFSGNPKVLGYISISMVFLSSPALIMFISNQFHVRHSGKIYFLTIALSGVGLFVLGRQIFGQTDMGESRILSHIAMFIGMVMVVVASVYARKSVNGLKNQLAVKLLPLLAFGIALDFLVYYLQRSSSGLMNTCLFFLVYLSLAFISSYRETSKMVYRDARTGLFNKARWNELMNDPGMDDRIGILVLDMNGLKKVNDTLGHEAGDRMIFAFAEILRNTLPSSSVICRWGGDEFTVMFPKISSQKLTQHITDLYRATEEYNGTDPEVEISFSCGEATSEAYPDKTRQELFRMADENMYRKKQQWYEEKKLREAAADGPQS